MGIRIGRIALFGVQRLFVTTQIHGVCFFRHGAQEARSTRDRVRAARRESCFIEIGSFLKD